MSQRSNVGAALLPKEWAKISLLNHHGCPVMCLPLGLGRHPDRGLSFSYCRARLSWRPRPLLCIRAAIAEFRRDGVERHEIQAKGDQHVSSAWLAQSFH